jgi:superfamily II DNA/RNA helicase
MLAIGGMELKDQRKTLLVMRPRVIVGTMGRVAEMIDKEYLSIKGLKVLAIDEADKFTTRGNVKAWQELIKLTSQLPEQARIVAFSATYSEHQIQTIQHELERRGRVCRLFVKEESSVGKVPENIKVVNIEIDCSGGITE